MQLYINLLNIVNGHIIFTWKLLSIGVCIVTGYAGIAHFGDYPIFGAMYYAIFWDVALVYMILYEKAFRIPELCNELKALLRVRASQIGNKAERNIRMRQVMSIPPMGIKVGEFHMLERTSTPAFAHYVLTNIVNMLVAYE